MLKKGKGVSLMRKGDLVLETGSGYYALPFIEMLHETANRLRANTLHVTVDSAYLYDNGIYIEGMGGIYIENVENILANSILKGVYFERKKGNWDIFIILGTTESMPFHEFAYKKTYQDKRSSAYYEQVMTSLVE